MYVVKGRRKLEAVFAVAARGCGGTVCTGTLGIALKGNTNDDTTAEDDAVLATLLLLGDAAMRCAAAFSSATLISSLMLVKDALRT